MLSASFLLAFSTSARAADCSALLARADGLAPDAVAGAFKDLVSCDKKTAETNFLKYLVRATDSDALVGLVMTAVDADVWHRVRIGPLSDLAEVNRLRSKLRSAELDALVIRVGD